MTGALGPQMDSRTGSTASPWRSSEKGTGYSRWHGQSGQVESTRKRGTFCPLFSYWSFFLKEISGWPEKYWDDRGRYPG